MVLCEKVRNVARPLGTSLYLSIPGEHGDYDLYSGGADNAVGGVGENQDITNW